MIDADKWSSVLGTIHFVPNTTRYEISFSENLIEHVAHAVKLIIIKRNPKTARISE
jgi:hypothetical protein